MYKETTDTPQVFPGVLWKARIKCCWSADRMKFSTLLCVAGTAYHSAGSLAYFFNGGGGQVNFYLKFPAKNRNFIMALCLTRTMCVDLLCIGCDKISSKLHLNRVLRFLCYAFTIFVFRLTVIIYTNRLLKQPQ